MSQLDSTADNPYPSRPKIVLYKELREGTMELIRNGGLFGKNYNSIVNQYISELEEKHEEEQFCCQNEIKVHIGNLWAILRSGKIDQTISTEFRCAKLSIIRHLMIKAAISDRIILEDSVISRKVDTYDISSQIDKIETGSRIIDIMRSNVSKLAAVPFSKQKEIYQKSKGAYIAFQSSRVKKVKA